VTQHALPARPGERVKALALALGFDLAGIAPAEPTRESEFLRSWLARGFAGDMHWIGRRVDERVDPRLVLPGARSLVALACVYDPGARGEPAPGELRIARYAGGEDYHDVLLERVRAFEDALPPLLDRCIERGWRVVVQTAGEERRDMLDTHLWTYRDDSFLPHAPADEPGAARQPILLTLGEENPNGADALFLVDGADPGELAGYARCVVLFDGADAAQLAVARAQWSAVKARGYPVSYWKQQGRGWEKLA
jgi:DNA polymerase-3 subunit chi